MWEIISAGDANLRPANYCNDGIRSTEKSHTLHRKPTKEPGSLKNTDKAWGVKDILALGIAAVCFL